MMRLLKNGSPSERETQRQRERDSRVPYANYYYYMIMLIITSIIIMIIIEEQ